MSAYVSQADAAAYLGVTTRTIRNYIASGRLPAYRIRGSQLVRVKQSDVDALLRRIPTVDESREA